MVVIPELKEEYREDEALKICCVAVLRVCNPGARDYELEEMYESSFLSELHPGVALSKNTVSALHKEVGRTYSRTMALLRRGKKIRIGEHGEWLPVRMNPSTGKMLAALGLDIAASEQPKRRPGRPPKNGTPA